MEYRNPEPGYDATYTSSLLIDEGGVPNDFVFSPDYLTVYIADAGTTNTTGGIERWDTATPFTNYALSYTLEPIPGSPADAQGLTAVFPTNVSSWGAKRHRRRSLCDYFWSRRQQPHTNY